MATKQNQGLKTWEQRRKDWKDRGNKVSPNFGFKTNKQGTKTAYMSVPASFVTLPQDAHVIQRKTLFTGKYNGKDTFDQYVLCAGTKRTYVSKQTQQPVVLQNWYVARIKYYGGKPGVAEWLYQGTSQRDARKRFAEIPYHELQVAIQHGHYSPAGSTLKTETYTDTQGREHTQNWAIFKSDGSYRSIVANRVQRQTQYKAWRASQGAPTQSPRPYRQ